MPKSRSTTSSAPLVAAAQLATSPADPSSGSSRELAVPSYVLPHRTSRELIALARKGLAEADDIPGDGLRFAAAHLAALRTAAAVLAARAVPSPRSRRNRTTRVTSAWKMLVVVAPELSEWAEFFAAGASKRAAAEAGIPRVVTTREADDLLRAAETFVDVVEAVLGLSHQSPPQRLAS